MLVSVSAKENPEARKYTVWKQPEGKALESMTYYWVHISQMTPVWVITPTVPVIDNMSQVIEVQLKNKRSLFKKLVIQRSPSSPSLILQ